MPGYQKISAWVAGLAIAFAIFTVGHSSSLRAQEIIPSQEYEACMNLARTKPDAGFERALSWSGLGGGGAAKHCAAVALLGLGQFTEAARRLELLAAEVSADRNFKADVLGQAGQAWLLANQLTRAESVLTAALELSPTNVELLIDRAQVFAERRGLKEAISDLDRVLVLQENHTVALIFRASAYRQLNQFEDAARDLWRALILAPDNAAALLERGIVARLQGDNAAARKDWSRVLELAPDDRVAELARANIEKMDGPKPTQPRR